MPSNPPDMSHQTCPNCGHNGCTSLWRKAGGGYSFFCHSCDSKGNLDDSFEITSAKKEEPDEVQHHSDPYVPDTYRGITKEVMQKEGVYFTDSMSTGEQTVHYHYPESVKHRTLPKTIRVSGPIHHFWGHEKAKGGKIVLITEGEEDRLSAIQIVGGSVDVLSLPNSTPSKTFWENAQLKLANYKKIVVSADNDDAGDKVARKIYSLFPGKVYLMDHGEHKDANDFLQAGEYSQYRNSFWNATRLKPDNILSTKQDFEDLFNKTPDYEYFETGIHDLDNKMLGIHKGAFTVILSETGIGKTEFFRYLEHVAISKTDYKIAFCHGEETQLRSILGLFSYHMGKKYITKTDVLSQDGAIDDYMRWIDDVTSKREQIYQYNIRVDEGVDEIVSQVRFMANALGVDYIFLEPIQDFVSAISTTEKESLLTDLTNKLKRLAPELNVGIVVIAHCNKEGEAKYAASIVQGAAYEIRLSRDVDAEIMEDRNRMYVHIGRKNRTGGGSGPAGMLDFHHDSFTLQPVNIVEPEGSFYEA